MKIQINKIKNFFGSLILFIIKHDFLVCLFLLLLSLVLGGLLVYSILVQKVEHKGLEQTFLIEEKNYQEILKIWQENEKTFLEADFKQYLDPFEKTGLTE